jgi:hypothetical protein
MGGCGCKKKKQSQNQEPANINTSNVQQTSQQTQVTEEDKMKLVNEIMKKIKKS